MEKPMKTYSLDLRQRAVELHQKLSNAAAVARQLQVSRTWVQDMVRLWQTTGSLDDRSHERGRHPQIGPDERECLKQWLKEKTDLTLKELQQRLAARGVEVSHTAVDNALRVMNITRKKKHRRRGTESAGRPGQAGPLAL
jgi:putative transposase